MPTTNAIRAIAASGSVRVRRRRRRSASVGIDAHRRKVKEALPACFYSRVTVLDWAIIAFTLALALWGYRQGLIVGALTLVGFGVGAFAGSRIGPLLLTKGSHSPYAPLCAALGALLVGALMAVTVESFALGLRERIVRRPFLQRRRRRRRRRPDRLGRPRPRLGLRRRPPPCALDGAAARRHPAVADPAQPQRRTAAERAAAERARPRRPGADRARPGRAGCRSRARRSPTIPTCSARANPWSASSAPPAGSGSRARAGRSAPDIVVTNAHVVAGSDDTTVTTQDGVELEATPVYYQPRRDLALLRVGAGAAAAADQLRAPGRGGRGGARIPRKRPLRASAGADRRDPGDDQRGLLWQRAGRADDRGDERLGPQRQLRRAAGRLPGRASSAPSSPRPPAGPRGGFAIPAEQVRQALRNTAEGVDTGPCTRLTRQARHLRSVSSKTMEQVSPTEVQGGDAGGGLSPLPPRDRVDRQALDGRDRLRPDRAADALRGARQGGSGALRPAALAAAARAGGRGTGRTRGRSRDAGAGHLLADRSGPAARPGPQRAEERGRAGGRKPADAGVGREPRRRACRGRSRSAPTRASSRRRCASGRGCS